ncbi:uncharacterized protein LOC108837757 [Raphanus sativus]|uniref:Uncharacterized protein LOC108837757 n=1 Tax=Raphanus sativus TaxID=3726 RepID=A0A6J0M1V3_RAPSA|nr:uncharacterized protein LOC108837757 [Raphanus sativus]
MNPSGSTSPWKAEAGGLTERNVKTSEKVKTFFWKTYHQGLPVGEQFAIKNIHLSPLCRRCNGTESITHLLFYCPYASQVWALAPLSSPIDTGDITSTLEGWERVRKLQSLPPVGLETGTLAASIVWNIWIARNHLLFQNRDFSPEETILKAITDAREWLLAQPPMKIPQSKPLIMLEPNPMRSGVTIYADAAWNPSSESAGFGWIIDDRVSATNHSATSLHVSSPLIAEALAVRSALTFALSCGFNSITLLSDSQSLISIINKKELQLEIFNIIRDIYHLSVSFISITFSFIPKSTNANADHVAKQALWALNPV